MKQTIRRAFALLTAAALLLGLFSGCADGLAATSMHLKRTQGTVDVSDSAGLALRALENLSLYGGYQVSTRADSYAWIDLDEVKLTKMDQRSGIEIRKEGRRLEIEVKSGSLFFNITEPLAEDETLNIRTSTMIVGIRGTCGWVCAKDQNHMSVYLLEGTVECSAGGETATVKAGETAAMTSGGEISVAPFEEADVPTFVRDEVKNDEPLAAAIREQTGMDFYAPLGTGGGTDAPTGGFEAILAEYRDARVNALPYSPFGEDQEEMRRNYEANQAKYPHVSPAYLTYFTMDSSPIYAAYHDLNGDGTEEMILGIGQSGIGIMLLEVYVLDGTDAVMLTGSSPAFETCFSAITGDGLILDISMDAVTNADRIYRLRGTALERVTDSGIPGSVPMSRLDLSAHGGLLTDRLDWQDIAGGGAPPSSGDAPTDGRVVTYSGPANARIRRTVLALEDCPLEMMYEIPVLPESSEGYRAINAFFQALEDEVLGREHMDYMRRMAMEDNPDGDLFYDRNTARIVNQTDKLVCVRIDCDYYAGGDYPTGGTSYHCFRTDTGERLTLSGAVDGEPETVRNFILSELEQYGESIYLELFRTYSLDDFKFYVDGEGAVFAAFSRGEGSTWADGIIIKPIRLPVGLKEELR